MKEYKTTWKNQLRNLLSILQHLGIEDQISTISVEEAVNHMLEAKAHRRPRTLAEIRSVMGRMMRANAGLAQQPLAQLGREDCEQILEQTFASARQRAKGRIILHGLFNLGCRRRWCLHNPISVLDKPQITEQEIHPLSWEEIQRLLCTARQPDHRLCMPAVGLMLWAGLRPAEVERIDWTQIDWEEGVIVVRAQHAKTGGCRHVTISHALRSWLHEGGIEREGLICPPNWGRRWKKLRHDADLLPWRQDVLRHTFASYHAKHWRDFALLQLEMGHRSAELLRTRYLSMRGLSSQHARLFWCAGAL